MTNQELIEKFYQSFSDGNAIGMIDCYHDDIEFEDPAFGQLKGDKAKAMWQMLLSRKGASPTIQFSNITADEKTGSATWIAAYKYGKQQRNVVNHISATFEFQDGKIIRHTDDFDLWKWSRQALGFSGLLLGWSGFMRNKIQGTTNQLLRKYMEK